MTGKDKIAELEKAISEKRAELAAVQQEKKSAADSPKRLVLAEKKERRIAGQIKALESARAAATYTPPEPTDREELLQGFKRYAEEHAAKVRKVQDGIKAAEADRAAAVQGLQQAAEECDTEKTVELSEKKAETESRLAHLREMLGRVSALPIYPEGAALEEWAAICEKALPDWDKAVLRVETLAAEYKAACRDLMAIHDTLKSVRDEIGRMEAERGYTPPLFPPVFTAGLDSSKLTVSKGDYIRLAGIESPMTGRAL